MFVQIVLATPFYVWGILVALFAVGLMQARDRTAPRAAIVLPGLIAAACSIYAVRANFPDPAAATGAWFVGFGVAVLVQRLAFDPPAGVTFDPAARRYRLPGSPVPMMLLMALFAINYAAGVERILDPSLAARPEFVQGIPALLGAVSGLLFGRVVRLLKAARSVGASVPA